MSFILDTCTFIWLTSEPNKISKAVAEIIDQEDTIYISDVSCLEISLKWSSNKLKLPSSARVWFEKQIDEWKLISLKLEREHIYRSSELGQYHKDPYDRLLIAQALAENLTILTPDKSIMMYPVSVYW